MNEAKKPADEWRPEKYEMKIFLSRFFTFHFFPSTSPTPHALFSLSLSLPLSLSLSLSLFSPVEWIMHSLYLLRSQARLSRVTKKLRLNGVEAQKFSVEANLESWVGTSLNVVVGVVVALVLVYSWLINSKLRQLETRYSTSSVVMQKSCHANTTQETWS